MIFTELEGDQADYVFETYGDEFRQSAESVANAALTIQEDGGNEIIATALARIPAFAIATLTTSTTDEPATAAPGYIGTLLLPSEVAAFAEGVELTTNYIDRKSMVADVDPSSVEHMDSFDSQILDTADGSQSFYLNTIKFDSEEAATNHLDLLRSEAPGMQEHTTKIGDTSFFAEINEFGIGSTVVFKKGSWVVMLHTTQSADAAPLVDLAGIEALAQTVADRL